jgi:hypothetical protein|tara:strand:+ start:1161 stop:1268 length:108 start_codon:yes stop_codon:yes gene_type:complete
MIGAIVLGGFVSVISLEKMEKPISNQFEYKGRPNN